MINPESMRITIISGHFPGGAVNFSKIFCLKLLEIHLNTIPETVVLVVHGCILIEPVCNKLVDQVMVSCLNVKPLSKESF